MPLKVHCERCHRHVSECGRLSARKRCIDCGIGEMLRFNEQMRAKSGPGFEHWLHRTILALLNINTGAGSPVELFSDAELEQLTTTTPAPVVSSVT